MKIPSKKNILLILAAILIIIQFFKIDKTNPAIEISNDILTLKPASAEVTSLLKSACYDCHSHETSYPWYTNVQPIAWWVKGHIKGGRQHLNFSEWGTYSAKKKNHKIEECLEELGERNMPLKSYTWVHAEAKLNKDDVNTLLSWFKTHSY